MLNYMIFISSYFEEYGLFSPNQYGFRPKHSTEYSALELNFKFNEGSLPVYLQKWDITTNAHVHNYNSREFACIHTFKVKHEFAKKMSQI